MAKYLEIEDTFTDSQGNKMHFQKTENTRIKVKKNFLNLFKIVKLTNLMRTLNSIDFVSIRFGSKSSEISNTLSIRKFFLVFDSIRFDSIWYALNSRVSLYKQLIPVKKLEKQKEF